MKPNRRHVLVIGGAGFIGTHVVDALHAAGWHVTVMDVVSRPATSPAESWITGSIGDISLLSSLAAGNAAVVFLANSSLPASSDATLADEVLAHVHTTLKVAESCASLGVERFVFASSGGTVYGIDPPEGTALSEDTTTNPRNAYGVSKLAIEHYLRLLGRRGGMRTLSLRLSNPYGKGQRANRNQGFIAAAFQHVLDDSVLPIWGDGSVERDFVHVSDVARAFVQAIGYDGPHHAINIGSGQGTSLRAVLGLIEQVTGRQVAVAYSPERAIDVARNVLDIGRAGRDLDWHPQIGLHDGLRLTWAWWQAQQP